MEKWYLLALTYTVALLIPSNSFSTQTPEFDEFITENNSITVLSFTDDIGATPTTDTPDERNDTTTDSGTPEEDGGKIPIYLGAFFSFGGSWDNSGILPAVDLALDHINNDPYLLADYDLRMVWNDTQCQAGLGTRVLFDQLFHKPQKIMILGPGCSTATQAVAETSYYWNLVTMSFAASSSALSNRKKYPYFYRTYMPDALFNPARIRLMKDFGWTRVATIHENHDLFSLAIDDLLTLLKKANITIIASESFAEDPHNQIVNLKNQDARIIVTNMYEDKARRVFCEAYKLGMTGEGYVWFMIGWYKDKWWMDEDPTLDCTLEQMREAVEGSLYISTESLQLSPSQVPGVSGLTAETYMTAIREKIASPEYRDFTLNDLAPYGYDAAWAIALMLNRSVEVLETKVFQDGSRRRLEDFTYDDGEMAFLFFKLLNETNFDGLTGPVSFKDGDRVGITKLEQLQPRCLQSDQVLSGSSCLSFVDNAKDFQEARNSCLANGYSLARIRNRTEMDTLQRTWSDSRYQANTVWYVGHYFSVDGESLDPTSDGEQSDAGIPATQCLVVDFNNGNRWRVVGCSEQYPFICSQDADYFEREVGLYTIGDDLLIWDSDLIWPGGVVPLDRTPEVVIITKEVYTGIDLYLFIIMSVISSLGILLALFFLAFNIKYRNQRHVKMSSPNLNNLIILGSILVYIWVFLYGLDGNLVSSLSFQIICQLRTWILCIGFVVAFGAMFSKTWRVHKVASFKTPKRRIIRDSQLYLMVFILLLIDVFILMLWQIIDPMVVERRELHEKTDPDDENVRIQPYFDFCRSEYQSYWLGAIYVYKGLLLIFGTFLAWETRKVTIAALNDSKLIGISVYNVIILCVIGVGVSFSLGNDPAALFAFVACIVIFCTSITLIVVFVPKIISVYKHPLGDDITTMRNRTSTGPDSNEMSNSNARSVTNLSEDNRKLEDKITELESKLKKKSNVVVGSGDKVCGLWCFGLSCGCSAAEDVETDRYRLKHELSVNSKNGTAGVYTGDERNGDIRNIEATLSNMEEVRNPQNIPVCHDNLTLEIHEMHGKQKDFLPDSAAELPTTCSRMTPSTDPPTINPSTSESSMTS